MKECRATWNKVSEIREILSGEAPLSPTTHLRRSHPRSQSPAASGAAPAARHRTGGSLSFARRARGATYELQVGNGALPVVIVGRAIRDDVRDRKASRARPVTKVSLERRRCHDIDGFQRAGAERREPVVDNRGAAHGKQRLGKPDQMGCDTRAVSRDRRPISVSDRTAALRTELPQRVLLKVA